MLFSQKKFQQKYFEGEVLLNMGLKGTKDIFCNKLVSLNWLSTQHDVFFEITIEFYTTFKILDANQGVFSYGFFGKEYYFKYEIMSDIFGFLERGCRRRGLAHAQVYCNRDTV